MALRGTSLTTPCQRRPFVAARPVCRRPVTVSAAMTLYANPASRSKIIEWYLAELGASKDVEVVNLDMKEKQQRSEWFLKINPIGKVPALVDGDLKLAESGAILQYLAEKYGKLPTLHDRAIAAQWALFANSTLAISVFVEANRERSMPGLMGDLNRLLEGREWLHGDAFSVVDVMVGSYLLYIPAFIPQLDLSPWPNIKAYMARLAARPACATTVAAPRPAPHPAPKAAEPAEKK